MRLIGVDPGKTGAFSVLNVGIDDKIVGNPLFEDMPQIAASAGGKKRVDWVAARNIIERLVDDGPYHFAVEDLWGFGAAIGAGGTGTFPYGRDYGVVIGIIVGQRRVHTFLTPTQWQKLSGKGVGTQKVGSVIRAEQLWPHIPFRGPRGGLLDGRAEALLMAYALYRLLYVGRGRG